MITEEPKDGTTLAVPEEKRLVVRADGAALSTGQFRWYELRDIGNGKPFMHDINPSGWPAVVDDRMVPTDIDLHDWVIDYLKFRTGKHPPRGKAR